MEEKSKNDFGMNEAFLGSAAGLAGAAMLGPVGAVIGASLGIATADNVMPAIGMDLENK